MLDSVSGFYNAAVAVGAGALQGLVLVEDQINEVVGVIEKEIAHFDTATFANHGHIARASFGDAEEASPLAASYTAAHAETYLTLTQTKERLLAYRDACVQAVADIKAADASTADELTVLNAAVGSISRAGLAYDRGARS